MSVLSDAIEAFLIRQIESSDSAVQLRRGELAQMFGCAPSQINYVLSTRFTPAHGYLIESQRGGGGYIRIIRVRQDDGDEMLSDAMERCISPVTEYECKAMLQNLMYASVITPREASVMASVLSEQQLRKLTTDTTSVRSDLFLRMLAALRIQRKKEQEHGTV